MTSQGSACTLPDGLLPYFIFERVELPHVASLASPKPRILSKHGCLHHSKSNMSHGSYEEIQISFSDGDVSRHPTNTTKPEPKADGSYDYFEPLGEDSSKGVLYRQKCAAGVIVDYLPAGTEGRQFMFKTLPAGYALFEHVKVNVCPLLLPLIHTILIVPL